MGTVLREYKKQFIALGTTATTTMIIIIIIIIKIMEVYIN